MLCAYMEDVFERYLTYPELDGDGAPAVRVKQYFAHAW